MLINPKRLVIHMTFQPPRGTRDFLPKEMQRRTEVFEKIRKIFESYGYGEVMTPAFEDFELLAKKSGSEIEKEIYAFEDKGGRKLGLRFDPTVPICRIVASDPSIPKPIKWYYITRMWRYDRPQAGRYREFWQAGLELIGSDKPEADAEILAVVYDSLKAIGIEDFVLKINSRKIVEELAENAGIPEDKKLDALRIIDKLDKEGEDKVKKEMVEYEIKEEAAEKFINMVKSSSWEDVEIRELKEILEITKKMGIDKVEIDLSIVRGIDYYTGFVFETLVKGYESLGSICSGGRYDSLIGIYSGKDVPATGFGMGLDRIMEVIKKKRTYYQAKVFVAAVSKDVKDQALEICQLLRRNGVSADVDLIGKNFKNQFNYVNSVDIPYVVIIGPKELKENAVVVRDMKTGKEEKVSISKLINYF